MATQLTPETAAAISSTVGIEPLLSLLQSNMEDRDSVAKVIKVLNAMIAAGDRTAAEYLSKPENMGKVSVIDCALRPRDLTHASSS